MKTLMMILTTLYVVGYDLPAKMNAHFLLIHAGNEIYCAASASGHTVVICDGSIITEDVTLLNGKVLKPDGTIISKDGTRTQMQPGECIGRDGKIVKRGGKDNPPKTKY